MLLVPPLAAASPAEPELLLTTSGEWRAPGESKIERVEFALREPNAKLVLHFTARLTAGQGTLRVLDPAGRALCEHAFERRLALSATVLGPVEQTGQAVLELSTQDAVGQWRAMVLRLPPPRELLRLLPAGPLMILVALGFTLGSWYWSRARWRWWWAGAGVWAVGVGLKIGWALLLNKPILHGLEAVLPRTAYVIVGGLYVGVLTGIFEIGATYLAARIWRRLAATAPRAMFVGVGAGSFEAVLLGTVGLAGTLVVVSGLPGTEPALAAVALVPATTPVVWLVSPVERVIAILCHVSSRTLVLLGVATHRSSRFWYGFLLLTAVDAIAGVAHVSGQLGWFSLWWLELAIAPLAVLSVPATLWCLRHWPADTPPREAAADSTAPVVTD